MVCTDCACKLDLMFDFRERSILTAHLFSDMITVNSGNVMNVEQNVIIESGKESTEEDVFNDYVQACEEISSKNDEREFDNELKSEICDNTEITTEEESQIKTKIPNNESVSMKAKSRPKRKVQRQKIEITHPNTIQVTEKVTTIRNEEFIDKKLVFNCDNSIDLNVFHPDDNELSNSLSNKDMLR